MADAGGPGALPRLDRAEWTGRAAAHAARVGPWIAPRLARRREGRKHPVDDFLFDYYSFRPAQLARWHPGPGVLLEAPAPHLDGITGFRDFGGWVGADPLAVRGQSALLPGIEALLRATAQRRARIGCSALHEWAMVYHQAPEEVRHADWPLRLSPAAIADVVDQVGLRCTHFDAYRFFTPDAAPRNAEQLTRASQPDHEQPGCLHATMDLYKWAYRLSPLIGADMIADTFALARSARLLDMRSAPYDLEPLGVAPIRLETAEGRAEFAAHQRLLADEGQALRARLLDAVGSARSWIQAQRGS